MTVPEPKKQPSGNWFIQLRLGGESVPVTARTAKECRDAAMLIKAEHKAGKREKLNNKTNPTLRQAVDSYIEKRSKALSPSTIRGYHSIRDNRFVSVMDKKVRDITDWQKIVNAETCSPKTLKNSWRLIASVLRDVNITPPKIILPQIVPNEHPWLEPEQIPVFIKAVKGKEVEIPALLALSSLRRSEICALDWGKINLKNKTIKVEGAAVFNEKQKLVQKESNKTKKSRRTVPIMIPELMTALSDVKDKTGLVVTCNPNTIWARINRICAANNLPKVGVHGLRHSFASLGYHLGMSEKEVMDIGGWSDFETLHKIYTHLAQSDLKKSQNKMARFYKNANKNANERKKV